MNRALTSFARFVGATLAALAVTAQPAAADTARAGQAHPMLFQQIANEQGLSQGNVLAIHQDREMSMQMP